MCYGLCSSAESISTMCTLGGSQGIGDGDVVVDVDVPVKWRGEALLGEAP